MAPAFESLGSECLSAAWGEYPWAPAIAMMSIFLLFIVEFFSFRWGTAKLKAAGFAGTYDQHGHDTNTHSGHGPEPSHVHAVPTACNPTVAPPPAEHHHHLTHSHTRSDAHGHTHSHDGHSHGIATVPESSESAAVHKKEALVDAEVSSSEDSSLDDEWAIGKGKQMSGDAIAQILVSSTPGFDADILADVSSAFDSSPGHLNPRVRCHLPLLLHRPHSRHRPILVSMQALILSHSQTLTSLSLKSVP